MCSSDLIKISIEEGIFMMGKQNGQIQMAILDIDSMIPEDHLLRQIKEEMMIFLCSGML